MDGIRRPIPSPITWTVMFVVMTLAVLIWGYRYYSYETNRIRQEKLCNLTAVADLKTAEIRQWRQERLADTRRNMDSPLFREAVGHWLRNPDAPGFQTNLLKQLKVDRSGDDYADVLLIEPTGRILLSTLPKAEPVGPEGKQAVARALEKRQAVLSEPYRCSCGRIHMDATAPILDDRLQPMAVLVLRANAESYLYSLIQAWPTPSRSAETLLVRRDGEAVLYLNELRHRTNTALSLRIPLTRLDLPAVQAVLGKRGVWQGKDYRGVDVLADLRPIPESAWFMVAKVDTDEILAEARYRVGAISFFIALLILLAGAVTAHAYRGRQSNLYWNLYEAERERAEAQEEFRATLYSIGDAVITTDKAGRVKRMNRVAEQLTGWGEAEVMGKPLDDIFRIVREEDRSVIENPVQRVLRDGKVVGLANHTLLIARDGVERPIADSGAPIYEANDAINGVVLVFRDQTEARRAEEALRKSEQQYRDFVESANSAIIRWDVNGNITFFNRFAEAFFGFTASELIGRNVMGTIVPVTDTFGKDLTIMVEDIKQRPEQYRTNINENIRKNGERVWVSWTNRAIFDSRGNLTEVLAVGNDVTEQKRAQQERETTIQFLRLVNESKETRDLIQKATSFFQQQSGCQAVGIRLRDGDDFPYYETRGFPPEFVLAENRLCALDANSQVVRDDAGNPLIECMCGNVICGRFDPSKPFFTTHGSFWTNSTTELLASTTEADRQARTRNRCNGEGYESVALLPLRLSEQRFGLLQLNDRRKDVFSPETIGLWERFADYLAAALAKLLGDEALRESEARYRSLFDNLIEGFAYCRMIYDDAAAGVDFIYLRVNPAFGQIVGVTPPEGKRVTEVFPGIKEAFPELFEIYGRVALTGQSESFELDFKPSNKWLHICVYSPAKEYFGAVFNDITERKQAEKIVAEALEANRKIVDNSPIGIIVYKATGQCVAANEAAGKILGTTVNRLKEQNFHRIESWKQSELYKPARQALSTQQTTSRQVKITTTFGVHLWLNMIFTPFRSNGELRLMTMLDDFTERKMAEDRLRASEEKYRSIFENSLVGIYQSTPGGSLIAVNSALAKIFGYGSPSEMVATVTDLARQHYVNPEDRDKFKGLMRTQGFVENLEFEIRRPDGSHVWLVIHGKAVRASDGTILYYEGMMQDITERKRAEEILRTLLEEKTALLKEIHHRVKNNLQIVDSILNLQIRRIANSTVIETLRDTQGRIRSMALLHETLYREDNVARVNCATYLSHLCAHLSRSFGDRTERIRLEARVESVELGLDDTIPCGLIVNELVTNAFKHAFPGERAGQITVELRVEPDHCLTLAVVDDGVGLPPGFAADSTNTLGMQFVKGLVHQIHGMMDIKTGPGAVFRINFSSVNNRGPNT